MNQRKLILFFLVFLLSFSARQVLAYNLDTHAYLTDEAINLYNRNFPNNPISGDFKDYLLDGSRREDDNIRSMNHFYDPVNDTGLRTSIGTWEESKNWADDSANQNSLKYKVPTAIASILSAIESGKISDISTESDFTWRKAVDYYANGEKEKAFFILGHILHLIEDTSVPEHTRDDLHLNDSPYENWTDQFKLQNKDPNLSARLSGKAPIQLSNLSSYFDELAIYSNNNFYSKNTIGLTSGYKSPEPDYFSDCGDYVCGIKSDDSGDYKILIKKRGLLNNIYSSNTETSIFLDKTGGDVIMKDYWFRLSTKAVQYSAGVINLFIKEAEAAKNDPNLHKTNEQKSFLASIASGAQGVISAIGGAIQKAANALQDILKQNNTQTEESQLNLPPENPADKITESVPTEIDSGLAAAEQVKEDVELLPASQEISLTEADKAAIAQMLARLDDLMRQAVELKTRIDSTATALVNKSSGNQITTQSQIYFSGGGGGISYAQGNSQQTVQDNSDSDGGIVNNTDTTTSTSEALPTQNTIDHVLISEILFDASGTDEGKEFIELYNPNGQSLDLAGWSLREIVGDSTSSTSLAVFKSHTHPEDKTIIPAKGFLLIGMNGFDESIYSKPADIIRAAALPNGGSAHGELTNIKIFLDDGDNNVVDDLVYNNSSIPGAGYSLERKTSAGSANCVTAQGTNEFYGHNCDMGAISDFEPRANPNPQNSENLPEPRQAPGFSGAVLNYSSSSLSLNFRWNESADASGATSSIIYR